MALYPYPRLEPGVPFPW